MGRGLNEGVVRIVGASARGRAHDATQTCLQDAQATRVLHTERGTVLLAAVADGAGSAAVAERGACTAVTTALDALACAVVASGGIVSDRMSADAFARAREAVFARARREDLPPRAYACTLLLAAASNAATHVAQIGDGAIVGGAASGLAALTWPQQGEYANETRFLIDDDALHSMQVAACGPVARLALFSDGLQNVALAYDRHAPFEPFFAPFFTHLESTSDDDRRIERDLLAFLSSPSVRARTDDDVSLVIAVRAR